MEVVGPVRIGVVSDTHGVLPPGVPEVFEGVDAIIHAGDIGGEHILYELEAIAPVTAVRGNTDSPGPTWPLPDVAELTIGGVSIRVLHDGRHRSSRRGREAGVVVTGHTHRPEVLRRGGSLHLNPGSPSRSRTSEGCGTVAILTLSAGEPRVEVVTLLP